MSGEPSTANGHRKVALITGITGQVSAVFVQCFFLNQNSDTSVAFGRHANNLHDNKYYAHF